MRTKKGGETAIIPLLNQEEKSMKETSHPESSVKR